MGKKYITKTHSIECSVRKSETYSLTIGMVEILCSCKNNKVLDVFGYLPFTSNDYQSMVLQDYVSGDFHIKIHGESYSGMAYDYCDKVVDASENLFDPSIGIDIVNGMIAIGEINEEYSRHAIKINNDIICIADDKNRLVALIILIEDFI